MLTSRQLKATVFAFVLGVCASAGAQTDDTVTEPAGTAAIGSTLSPVLLQNLPSANNLFQLLETTEGEITSDRFYGGGLNIGRQARDGAFLNSWTQSQFYVGDVNVTVPNGGAPFIFPVLTFWDRVDVATALLPLDTNAPGFAVSLQPVRPAAAWVRVFEGSGATDGFVAKPFAGPPPIETLRQWSHGSAFASGPVSPRVGLVAALDWSGASQFERDYLSQAKGQSATGFAHVVFTPNPGSELRLLGWLQRTQAPFVAATAFHEPLAGDQTTFTHVQGTWERRTTEAFARIYGAYSEADALRTNAAPSAPLVERLLDGPVPLLVDSGNRTDRQWSAGLRFGATPAASNSNNVSMGLDVGQSFARIGPAFVGGVGEVVDGTRARMWQFTNPGIDDRRRATTVTAFVNDRIVFSPGRTLDAGLGYDFVNGKADQAAQGISWQNVLPRVELRWRQSRNSHVTWVAGYRRAVDRLTFDTLAVGDPAAPTANIFRWTAQGVGPLVERYGPGTGGDPTFSAIDPSLARPTTDEVVAGIDVQLTPHIRGRITGVAKEVRHLFDLADIGAPISSYSASTIVDGRPASDGGDVLLPVYNRLPSTFGADRYLLANLTGNDTAIFEGLVLNGEASVKRLTVMLNATASQTDGPAINLGFHADENNLGTIGELGIDPNAAPSARGRLFYDRAFTIKLTGIYAFPGNFIASAIARYQDGQPFSRVTVVPDLNQGTELVRAYPAGDARFMFTGTLDVRLLKRLSLGATSVDLFVDGYNILNMHNEVEERVVTGSPAFRDITAIQPPLAVHIGARVRF